MTQEILSNLKIGSAVRDEKPLHSCIDPKIIPNKLFGNNKKQAVACIAYVNVRITENIIWQITEKLIHLMRNKKYK